MAAQRAKWSLHEACSLLLGVEDAARLLIAEMDKRLSRKDSRGKVLPDTKGIAVVCIMTCAYFCEVSLKTLQSSLNGGFCSKGHDLEKLYDEVEKAYSEVHTGSGLESEILSETKAYYSRVPPDWWPSDVRTILKVGALNFTEWRYGYTEDQQERMGTGVPRQLYAIAAGVFRVCLKQNLELWAEPGKSFQLPDPSMPPGGGYSVVEIE